MPIFNPEYAEQTLMEQIETAAMDNDGDLVRDLWTQLEKKHGSEIHSITAPRIEVEEMTREEQAMYRTPEEHPLNATLHRTDWFGTDPIRQ